jgi:hypothetical protein
MKTLIKILVIVLILFFWFNSCRTGYVKKHGKVYYKYIHGGNWTMVSDLIDSADAATFTTIETKLNLSLGKDKDHVFKDPFILRFADPNTFEQVKEYYWKDKNYVFLIGVDFGRNDFRVVGADPKTFVLMTYPWSKDANHVYYYVDSLEKVNPNAFISIDEDWGKDGRYYYLHTSKIDLVVYDEAVVVSKDYIKDKEHVFYHDKLVKDANPKTFKADGAGFFGHDDKYMFDEEKNTGPITEEYRNTYINQK